MANMVPWWCWTYCYYPATVVAIMYVHSKVINLLWHSATEIRALVACNLRIFLLASAATLSRFRLWVMSSIVEVFSATRIALTSLRQWRRTFYYYNVVQLNRKGHPGRLLVSQNFRNNVSQKLIYLFIVSHGPRVSYRMLA